MPPRPPSFLPLLHTRAFSTTPTRPARPAASQLAHQHATIPPYPHGPSPWYKQSNFGLYGSAIPQSGNTVSERTEIKNRRKWHPNIQTQRLYSEALGRFVRVKVLAKVLRTIDKVGGLDEYLLGEKSGRVRELGMGGWALRWRVMRTEWYTLRREGERRKLGLPVEGLLGAVDGGSESEIGVMGGVIGEEGAVEREGAIDRVLERVEGMEDEGVELGVMEEGREGKVGKEKSRVEL
ncbi:39S ribosomal protein L24, mitochondrial [Trapelia coarctata]|nr:39S ribosomal protein L24, mitochondrial [Trapelia coarctata]